MTVRFFPACAAFFLGFTLVISAVGTARAQLFDTKAKQAFMIDAETGTVLYSKSPDDLIPPASLAKLMTMEVVFNALKAGRYTMEDTFQVSEHAWRTGGAVSGTATMFAALKSSVSIGDLIQGVIVQTANDGCIILAEGMAGSEANFAAQMTDRAKRLGLKNSVFVNATGLPADGQSTTVREMTLLARHLWEAYPDYYAIYSQSDFTWNKITQKNRNPLISMDIGADGLGTGYAEGAGYAIVGSVNRGGKRVFAALGGLGSERERLEEARKLLDWGLTAFERRELFARDEVVGEAQLYGGAKSTVALKADGPVQIFVPITNADRLVARIVYDGPVEAPVVEGTPVGKLRVWVGDTLSQETPLFAAESIGLGTLEQRAMDAVGELLIGWLRKPKPAS